MSKYVLQISSSVKYIALGKTTSCFMAILLDQLILRYRPLKYFSPGSITWPHLSDNLDSATPFSEQNIKALLDCQLTMLQRKEPLQTQKHVALRRLQHFHHQAHLNDLNPH